jgi:hypothetical protein
MVTEADQINGRVGMTLGAFNDLSDFEKKLKTKSRYLVGSKSFESYLNGNSGGLSKEIPSLAFEHNKFIAYRENKQVIVINKNNSHDFWKFKSGEIPKCLLKLLNKNTNDN